MHTIVSGQPVLYSDSLDISCVISSSDVLLHPSIDTASNEGSLAVLAPDKVRSASSSRSRKRSKTAPALPSKRPETSTVQTRSDAAKPSFDDMPVIDIQGHRE